MKKLSLLLALVFIMIIFINIQANKSISKNITNTTISETDITTVKNNKSKAKQQNSKKIIGDTIPDWVYENSSDYDDYYDILTSSENVIFFAYANCPIGRSRKKIVEEVVSDLFLDGRIRIYADLKPENSVTIPFCHKLYEEFAKNEVMEVAKERQGDTGRHAILKIKDGVYCIPPVKNNKLPDGACNCSVQYFLDNCSGEFCIINPKARKIIKVAPTYETLEQKLNEIADNWEM